MARSSSPYKHKIFVRKTIDTTFKSLITLIIFSGGAYVNEHRDEVASEEFASEQWFKTSSIEYGWPGDEIPAAVIISEEPIPEGILELQ